MYTSLKTAGTGLFMFIAAIVVTHLAFAVVLTKVAERTFDLRGPNLRLFDFVAKDAPTKIRIIEAESRMSESYSLATAYLETVWKDDPDERRALVLGSSVSWGYPMQPEASLTGQFSEQFSSQATFANVAIIGFGMKTSASLACSLAKNGVVSGVSFLEIPVLNDSIIMMREEHDGQRDHCTSPVAAKAAPGYFPYYAQTLRGVSMLTRSRRMYPDRPGSRVIKRSVIPENYKYTNKQILDRERLIRDLVRKNLVRTADISGKVVAFTSPVYLKGFREENASHEYLETFARIAMDECAKFGNAVCIDPIPVFADQTEMFRDVAHLNRKGMAKLARILWEAAKQK